MRFIIPVSLNGSLKVHKDAAFLSIYVADLFFSVITIVVVYTGGTVLYKHHVFHSNLRKLLYCGMYANIFAFFIRMFLFPYQIGVLTPCEPVDKDVTMVFINFVRLFFMIYTTYVVFGVSVERLLATVFLTDYEKRERHFIFLIVETYLIIASVISCCLFVFEYLSALFCTSILLMHQILGVALFVQLWRINMRMHRTILRLPQFSSQYTLSERYQVVENIRVLKLVKQILVPAAFMNFLCCGVYVLPLLIEMEEYHVDLSMVIMNFLITVYAIPVLIVPYSLDPTWQRFVDQTFGIRWGHRVEGNKFPSVAMTQDNYFKQLRQQWN